MYQKGNWKDSAEYETGIAFSGGTRSSSCKLCPDRSNKTTRNKESVPTLQRESEAALFLAEAKGVWENPFKTDKQSRSQHLAGQGCPDGLGQNGSLGECI